MKEIRIPYSPGNTLTAVVFSPDGGSVWTSTGFQARPAAELLIPLEDVGGEGLYIGNFPTGITQAGNYPVIARDEIGTMVDTQEVKWNGIRAIAPSTIDVVSYSTVVDADSYFATRLYVQLWGQSTEDQRQAALNDATRAINRLCYMGAKTLTDQPNEWPRKGLVGIDSAVVPADILNAQFEIAFALLSGVNVEKELRSLGVTSRGYASVRITYGPGRASEWLYYGIPSGVAWAYLLPYLCRDSAGIIKLHRVS